MNRTTMAPFVKWAGGKRQMLGQLMLRMPDTYNRYYEPFVGGGALMLSLAPAKAYMNDINQELIHTYLEIRDQEEAIADALQKLDETVCTREFYYEMRSRYNEKRLSHAYDTEMAALFIYLNKHCYNGLYRVNSRGEFNVPWNQKQSVRSMDLENIKAISSYLKSVTITNGDFEEAVAEAKEGDFIFFDSPYAPLNPSSFASYTKEGFTEEEHRRLAVLFRRLTDRGVACMLTNHDTKLIRELYRDFLIEEIEVRRAINSDPEKRKGKEVIIRNYGKRIKKKPEQPKGKNPRRRIRGGRNSHEYGCKIDDQKFAEAGALLCFDFQSDESSLCGVRRRDL